MAFVSAKNPAGPAGLKGDQCHQVNRRRVAFHHSEINRSGRKANHSLPLSPINGASINGCAVQR